LLIWLVWNGGVVCLVIGVDLLLYGIGLVEVVNKVL